MIKTNHAIRDINYYREQLSFGLEALQEMTRPDFDVIEITALLKICNSHAEVVRILEECERIYVGERELINEQIG